MPELELLLLGPVIITPEAGAAGRKDSCLLLEEDGIPWLLHSRLFQGYWTVECSGKGNHNYLPREPVYHVPQVPPATDTCCSWELPFSSGKFLKSDKVCLLQVVIYKKEKSSTAFNRRLLATLLGSYASEQPGQSLGKTFSHVGMIYVTQTATTYWVLTIYRHYVKHFACIAIFISLVPLPFIVK